MNIIKALITASVISGCASPIVWGPEINGISCSLYKDDNESLVVSIRNNSKDDIVLPTWNDEVPIIRVLIKEEPGVLSPPNFGGAINSTKTMKPGDVFTYNPIKDYLLYYGYHADNGWKRFKPSNRPYHVTVSISTNIGEIRTPELETKLN